MDKKLLITRPSHEITTHYISKWSEKIIEVAKRKGMKVIDLEKEKANNQRFVGTLRKVAPGLVILNGHGSDECVTGHNNEVILNSDNIEFAQNAIIYARSCKSAKILGKLSISKGVASYIGYDENFVFIIDESKISKPLEDETAALFLEPTNYVSVAIIKGHTAGVANKKSKELLKNNIKKLLVGGSLSENYYLVRHLYWDMVHQVCLGDEDAKL
jgi:hypothetical protein